MIKKFLILTNVEHIKSGDRFYAYSPYVREMNLWLRYVKEVEVVAPRPLPRRQVGPKGEVRGQNCYQHENLIFNTIPSFHFLSSKGAVKSIIKIPYIFFNMFGAMRRADHLHLRCPGNIGLLACVCQIFFPSKPKSAKYAGNWDPNAKQPWSYGLQKWLLSNTFLTRNMQVLVYGEWPGQTKNIVPFFTASFSEEEKDEVSKKAFSGPFIFLFVGNLVEGKRPLEAIKLVEKLNKLREGTDQYIRASYVQIKLELYGDGLERKKLETYVRENDLEQLISFKGNRPLEDLKEAYQRAHFVILPSRSEGWPKALAEGMFYGCIPIATPVSCVPWMLGGGSRGILISERNLSGSRVESGKWKVESENQESRAKIQDGEKEWSVVSGQWSENIKKIKELLTDPERMKTMSEEAKKWSQEYTLEKFEKAIKEVLAPQPPKGE